VAAFARLRDFTALLFIGSEKVLSSMLSRIDFGRPLDSHPKIKYASG
jgi:hypothetical protein